jgi:hypothetical protein
MLRKVNETALIIPLRESLQNINKTVKRLSGPRGYNMLLDTLRERVINEDGDDVKTMHDKLLEHCGCNGEDDAAKPLLIAARYLANASPLPKDDIGVGFVREPDLISKVHDHADQNSRLAWQIDELAECVDDDGIRDRLKGISYGLKDSGMLIPDDIDFLRMVYKASKGIPHEPEMEPANPDLERIRALSGL